MRMITLLTVLALTPHANADDNERAAVMSAAQAAFDAVRSQKLDDWSDVLYSPDGNILAFRPVAESDTPAMTGQIVTFEQRLAGMEPDGVDLVETWIGEPSVLVHGPLAVIWGLYEFRIDGELSHCGITAMELAKSDGEWKIANWSFTVEPDGCPEAE